MIVSGPPGVGKSFGVEQEIEKATMFDKLAGKRLRAEVVKGAATPIGLYQTLYKYSDENCVVVFDDCDSILLDDVSLNLLKGALDSYGKRIISWNADMRDEDLPRSFNFTGKVIFISNLDQSSVVASCCSNYILCFLYRQRLHGDQLYSLCLSHVLQDTH